MAENTERWVLTYEMIDDETGKTFHRSEIFPTKEMALQVGDEYEQTQGYKMVSVEPEKL